MRMYVLVRRDLTERQKTVQTAHAATEFALNHCHDESIHRWNENHKTMVLLAVDNEIELKKWQYKLSRLGVPTTTFIEPDLGNQATAMACHPATDRRMFKKLPLL